MISAKLFIFLLLVVVFNVESQFIISRRGGGQGYGWRPPIPPIQPPVNEAPAPPVYAAPPPPVFAESGDEPSFKFPENYNNLVIPKSRSQSHSRGSGPTQEPPIVPKTSSFPINDTKGQNSSNISPRIFDPKPTPGQPAPDGQRPTVPQVIPVVVPVSNISHRSFGSTPTPGQPAPDGQRPTAPQVIPVVVPVVDNKTVVFTASTIPTETDDALTTSTTQTETDDVYETSTTELETDLVFETSTDLETVDDLLKRFKAKPQIEGSDQVFKVDVAMQIQSIREINEEEQRIIIDIDLTVHWKDYKFLPEDYWYFPPEDERLESVNWLFQRYKSEALSLDNFEKLWQPDIFIERVVRVKQPKILKDPTRVRFIRYTSSIIYTTRASVQVDCKMNFQYYPADTQHCILDMRSYQNDQNQMRLNWNPVPGAYLVDTDSDENFDVKLSYVAQKIKKVKNTNLEDATFDVLQIQLSMRRRMTYHLLQTYVPSALLVFITWLSFLIPEVLIEARMGISMTTLLTLTAMFAAVRENTPVVSYIRAIDIWMFYCIFIVFGTLLEFTFFVWLRNYKIARRKQKWQKLICAVSLTKMEEGSKAKTEPKTGQLPNSEDIATNATKAFEHTAKILNRFAFGFFVLNFVIFSLIYWPWLLIWSEHYQWAVNKTLNGKPEDSVPVFEY